MPKEITLKEWAEARYRPVPSAKTLRRWARDCWIFPVPEKVGREYRVREDARFIGNDYNKAHGSEAA